MRLFDEVVKIVTDRSSNTDNTSIRQLVLKYMLSSSPHIRYTVNIYITREVLTCPIRTCPEEKGNCKKHHRSCKVSYQDH